jgi:hypothetical protein
VIELLAPALLGALVAVQTFGNGQALAVDERVFGVAVAAIAIWRKAPLLVVVILATVTTARRPGAPVSLLGLADPRA